MAARRAHIYANLHASFCMENLFCAADFYSLIALCFGVEYERHNKREHHRRRDARACRRERAGYGIEKALFRPLYCAVGKQVPEAGYRHGGARAGKLDERLIQPERRQHHPREHEEHEYLARGERGDIYYYLRDNAYGAAHDKRL